MKLRLLEPRVRRMLLAFASVIFVVGTLFWLWNPEPDISRYDPGAERIPVASTSPPISSATTGTETIVSANIFSATRTPPRQRYNGLADESATSTVNAEQEQVAQPVYPMPQLFGTVVGGGRAMALMQDSAATVGRLFGVGEKIGHYRVVAIKPQSVVLKGPSGQVEIKVQRLPTGAQ